MSAHDKSFTFNASPGTDVASTDTFDGRLPSRNSSRRKHARPQELIDAALELFVEKGFAACRLDDVAARAGVVKGTLYRYFANKEDLFKAVIRKSIVPVIDDAEHLTAGHDGLCRDLLRQILLKWWEHANCPRFAGLIKLVIAEAGNFPEIARFYYCDVVLRAHGVIDGILERGMSRGEFRRLDVASTRIALIAPWMMHALWRHSFASVSLEQSPDDLVSTCIDIGLAGVIATDIASSS